MNKHVKKHFLTWIENKTDKKEQIEHHLQECVGCRLYYEKMTKLLDPEVFSRLPSLAPDPFMPTRIVSLVSEQQHVKMKIMFSKIKLALEGFALVLAVLAGIVLGKTISAQTTQNNTEGILNIYQNAVSQNDFSTQMVLILEKLEGDRQ